MGLGQTLRKLSLKIWVHCASFGEEERRNHCRHLWVGLNQLFCLPHPSPWTKQSGQMHYSTDSDRVTYEGLSFLHPWQAPGQDTGRAGGSMYPRL